MNYNVVQADTIYKLVENVNKYKTIGYEPIGGICAFRERVSAPIQYIQAVVKVNGKPENHWKRSHGK